MNEKTRVSPAELDYLIFDITARCKDKDGGTIHMRQCLMALQELQASREHAKLVASVMATHRMAMQMLLYRHVALVKRSPYDPEKEPEVIAVRECLAHSAGPKHIDDIVLGDGSSEYTLAELEARQEGLDPGDRSDAFRND